MDEAVLGLTIIWCVGPLMAPEASEHLARSGWLLVCHDAIAIARKEQTPVWRVEEHL